MAFLGLGLGSIDLTLNRTEFKQGEVLSGRVSLRLNEQVEARGLFIELRAEKQVSDGEDTKTVILFNQKITLDSSQKYPASTKFYNFEFKLPTGLLKQPNTSSGIMSGVNNFFSNSHNKQIKWIVEAKLDVPKAFDVNKKIELKVNP